MPKQCDPAKPIRSRSQILSVANFIFHHRMSTPDYRVDWLRVTPHTDTCWNIAYTITLVLPKKNSLLMDWYYIQRKTYHPPVHWHQVYCHHASLAEWPLPRWLGCCHRPRPQRLAGVPQLGVAWCRQEESYLGMAEIWGVPQKIASLSLSFSLSLYIYMYICIYLSIEIIIYSSTFLFIH